MRRPRLRWAVLWAGALVLPLAAALALEVRLAARGFVPTVADSPQRWAQERRRASALGRSALILVGSSRMQLDVDTAALRARTGRPTVQLAIDGSSFVPVFEDLAADASITGTIVVDATDDALAAPPAASPATRYVRAYERRAQNWTFEYDHLEARLADALHAHLRSYADGATPLSSTLQRAFAADVTPQYLITLPDRSRSADYTRTPASELYRRRVAVSLGTAPPPTDAAAFEAWARPRIAAVQPVDTAGMDAWQAALARLAAQVTARGGRVVFVRFPSSGYVREIEERRTPRARVWDAFARRAGIAAVHFDDVASMRGLTCPDGSHLDAVDRARFTQALADSL